MDYTRDHAIRLGVILGATVLGLSVLLIMANAFGLRTPRIAAGDRPNIVLIVSDDQREDTLQFMPILLEKLAGLGTTFSSAYVPTPLCCPSRSSILSGEYAHNHGVLKNDPPYGFNAFKDKNTLATWLHDAGYNTALYGKYLNGYRPTENDMYLPPGWDTFHAFIGEPGYSDYAMMEFGEDGKGDIVEYGSDPSVYSTDLLFGRAANAIRTLESNDNEPFFMYVAPYAPHRPTTPAPRHQTTNVEIPNAPSFNEADVSDKPTWIQESPLLTTNQKTGIETFKKKTVRTLQSLDEGIGTVVETLRDNGELDNTVIIYIGDNGFHWGEHRIDYGKISAYEESLHVPMVIFDGRKQEAQTVDDLVLNIDLAPTILGFAGIDVPPTIDGKALSPFFTGEYTAPWREDFVIESWSLDRGQFVGLHTQDWVYVEHEDGQIEMYDLVKDPYELSNLGKDPAYVDERLRFAERLQEIRSCTGEECT